MTTTKKQLLTLAKALLARNEEEVLTCYSYICHSIDIAATLTIKELDKRPWWKKLLRPTRRAEIRRMQYELGQLVEGITGTVFKLEDAERIIPGFNTLEIPEGYSPRQFARHLLLDKLIKEH